MTKLDLDLVPEPPAAPDMLAARLRRALVTGLGGGRAHDAVVAARAPCVERRLRASDVAVPTFVPAPGASARGGMPAVAGARGGAPGGAAGLEAAGGGGVVGAAAGGGAAAGARKRPRALADVGVDADGGPRAQARRADASGTRPDGGGAGVVGAAASGAGRVRAGAGASGGASPTLHAPVQAPQSLRLDDALVVPAGALLRGYLRCRALLLAGDIVGNVHCTAGPVVIRAGASLKGRLVASGDVYVCGTVGDGGGGAVISTRGKLTLAPGARVDGDVRSGRLDLYDGAMLHGVARASED